MNIEGFHKIEETLRDLEDAAELKAAVYGVSVDILPETIFMYNLGGALYEPLKQALEESLIHAPTNDPGELRTLAAATVIELLDKNGIRNPEIGRTFLNKLKKEMEMH